MKNEIVAGEKTKEILVFNLLDEELGMDISFVREVLKPQKIHPLPKTPEFIDGVMDLRGHIIVVINLRKKFNMPVVKDISGMRIIVCSINKFIVGLMVDSVSGVISLPEENIEPPPKVISIQIEDGYISGIARLAGKVIVLFNPEQIFTKDEITRLSGIRK